MFGSDRNFSPMRRFEKFNEDWDFDRARGSRKGNRRDRREKRRMVNREKHGFEYQEPDME